jgi:hypothetical protein
VSWCRKKDGEDRGEKGERKHAKDMLRDRKRRLGERGARMKRWEREGRIMTVEALEKGRKRNEN